MSTVTIPLEEYEELKAAAAWAEALDSAGVDNWDGFDYAREIYNDPVDEDGE